MPEYRLCAVIPVYNHGGTVAAVHAQLAAQGFPCVLVDDGSNADCATALDALSTLPDTHLVRRRINGGKGAAVQDGLRAAAALGFTHALQVDADGQHALPDAVAFANASREQPQAVICGAPVYGDDVPRSRLYGRWLTRVWVWINTLSLDIPDAMCGFRVYPLAHVLPVINRAHVGRRMDFDIAILVRLHWRGVAMAWLPTRVVYPEGGISHFKGLQDNLLISRMHARLFFGMLGRSPALLWRRLARGLRS
ncbi:glycosyltransferase family 2 protein [Achromobacter seleniivolatilans]|uniref:Glycosyltransferase family 2 protein n=1 Tax=Achromobacter seleniivolatilans TaxID=3047478 RepID=A0ABY9M7C7_9BURK|nr:glycosyltransferase family 2 protein [Achromobacter sp. R39]WMD22886.1 glycosyltransferase family 2 protein [Achromobacter sp. R39]